MVSIKVLKAAGTMISLLWWPLCCGVTIGVLLPAKLSPGVQLSPTSCNFEGGGTTFSCICTHTIHPPCYSFEKLVIPCNNFRVCKDHRNTGMIVHGCYNMVVYLPTQFNPLVATSYPTRLLQSHWKEPSLLVHPSSHPLMFISHSLISVENT